MASPGHPCEIRPRRKPLPHEVSPIAHIVVELSQFISRMPGGNILASTTSAYEFQNRAASFRSIRVAAVVDGGDDIDSGIGNYDYCYYDNEVLLHIYYYYSRRHRWCLIPQFFGNVVVADVVVADESWSLSLYGCHSFHQKSPRCLHYSTRSDKR